MLSGKIIIATGRLDISVPSPADAQCFVDIWTDAGIMKNVGFPEGLSGITVSSVADEISGMNDEKRVFGRYLKVSERKKNICIGECKMSLPDRDLVSETDIKLKSPFQRKGYGTELKRALTDYIFLNTDASAVQATPNVKNIASIRMQEKCGGSRIAKSRFYVSESMRRKHGAQDVDYYLYMIYKKIVPDGKACIIFDLDGTLLNTLGDMGASVNHVLEQHGLGTHPVEAYAKMVGNGMDMTVKRACPAGLDAEMLQKITDEAKKRYEKHYAVNTVIYPGMKEIVDLLRKKDFRTAVYTNKPHETAVRCVDHYFGRDAFDVIRGVKEDGLRKPGIELTGHMLRLLGNRADRTLFVGDSMVDRDTAYNAGLDCVIVEWGYGNISEVAECGVVRDPEQLKRMLSTY